MPLTRGKGPSLPPGGKGSLPLTCRKGPSLPSGEMLPSGEKSQTSLLDAKKHSVSSSDLGLHPTDSKNPPMSAGESLRILQASSTQTLQNGMVKLNVELLEKLAERRRKIDSDEISCHISPDQGKTDETLIIQKTRWTRRNCTPAPPTPASGPMPAPASVSMSAPASVSMSAHASVSMSAPASGSMSAPASGSMPAFVLDPSRNPRLKHLVQMLSTEMSSESDSNSAAAPRPTPLFGSVPTSSVRMDDSTEDPNLKHLVQLFDPKISSDSDSEFIY